MAKLVWTKSAKESLSEITSVTIRQRIRDVARLVKEYPQLHPLVRTRSWGQVGHFRVAPFVVIYQFSEDGRQCAILDVLHDAYFASREKHP